MPIQVCTGATMMCSFGVAPSTLTAIPKGPPVNAGGPTAATIMDYVPMANVPPFGMCITPTNPMVASATAAASGVLTPQPCIPVLQSPWAAGAPNVLINGTPALDNISTCTCLWGGVITITNPGEMTVQVP